MRIEEVTYSHPAYPRGRYEVIFSEEEYKRFKRCNRFFHSRLFCLNGKESCEFRQICREFDKFVRIRIEDYD